MKAIVFVLIFAVAFAVTATHQGEILCNLCTGLINTLENLLTTKGADKVKDYISSLCNKASGFIATLCTKVLDFGIDKLIQLIEDKVDANAICAKIHAC
ncbi:nonpathogenic pore-forming peptide precursor, putative [Entamoeba histolytica HM-1:IMSS-B]|uniref:Pore-forming peptide amoebapore A n=7 Tax=Entamoeba histolytica TaxID=5759 RepID=PFPA_ENTH1|nr:pore-forming peptide ameobapore A precursor, putative [Entamoeba histolytica HM-1:IMSS]P34095.1 RecName: Full=Pore-forming peptide amoebapore A; AltName: Full=EhAPP A; Flags: Precursor [Entamoeba histolytica HM-1:IMSS]AAA29111.1 pore-forming peptide [Entamoeba histolytica]EMD47328.1 amoebapore A, putative [Entamoeba histolytica KU27]EMH73183.1 nonpathogenic pore-forming peptide precursor, putative [Entamoeba histolytica HM-1:IMSS-B]EMS12584.1 amoebapore a, putative [Entamoeba histolytica HM|eukprot:XP_653265.1 pore-forming peptide ameobapore A precursor, putative [Entamoeba histolytica HM-1:IMSS]